LVQQVDQGSLALPRWVLVNSDDGPNIPTISAYTNFVVGSAKAVRNFLGSNVSNLEIGNQVNDMLQFEMKLAKITTPDESRYNQTRMFNPMPLSKLQDATDSFINVSPRGQIDWSAYLNGIYNTSVGIVVNSSERVVVAEKFYVNELLNLLDSTPNRVIGN
jgi:Peptidase family M13